MATVISLPDSKSKEVNGCGWITPMWWSNGSYSFQYEGKRFWRLCLERKGKPNVGYNATLTQVGKRFKGLIWLDAASQGYDERELAEKVKKHFKVR